MYATDTPIRPSRVVYVLLHAQTPMPSHPPQNLNSPAPVEKSFAIGLAIFSRTSTAQTRRSDTLFRASYENFLQERDGQPIKACMGKEKVCMCVCVRVFVCVWLGAVVKIGTVLIGILDVSLYPRMRRERTSLVTACTVQYLRI